MQQISKAAVVNDSKAILKCIIYLPQAEGVLLHALDDRSRVCG
jgi:hypothetical protein